MLHKLMKAVAEGQARSLGELAKHLGVCAGLVEQMLEDLSRQGYLRLASMECDSGCAACASEATCNLTQLVRTWVLTEKGNNAAERSSTTANA